MDKIFFQNLRFYGYHGVFRHEELRGQYFELDLELACDLRLAGHSGQTAPSIDYARIYQLVKTIVTERCFGLLEALGECLCTEILASFPKIENVMLRLRKPEAPLEGGIVADQLLDAVVPPWKPGLFGPGGGVGIELQRSRS